MDRGTAGGCTIEAKPRLRSNNSPVYCVCVSSLTCLEKKKRDERGSTTGAIPRRAFEQLSRLVCVVDFTEVFGEEEERYDERERGRMHNRSQSTFAYSQPPECEFT
jgi:hypothetical protein